MTQPYSEFSVLPTEPVGSIPRPDDLIAKFQQFELGRLSQAELALAEDAAVGIPSRSSKRQVHPLSRMESSASRVF
jgi:hypothetical protein